MDLLECDQEASVGQRLQRLGVAGALDRERVAVAVEDRMELWVGQAAELPGLVADQAGDQPVAEIGDCDQALAAVVDDQARIAAEPGVSARKLESGDELELAGAGDLGVARVKLDGLGGQAKRLGRRRERQEQRDDENAPGAQDEAPAI